MFKPDISIEHMKKTIWLSKLEKLATIREKVALSNLKYKNKRSFYDLEIGLISPDGELIYSETMPQDKERELIAKTLNAMFFKEDSRVFNSVQNFDIYPRRFFAFEDDNRNEQLKIVNCKDIDWDYASRDYYLEKSNAEKRTKASQVQAVIRLSFSRKRYFDYIDNLIEEQDNQLNTLIQSAKNDFNIKENMVNFIFNRKDIDVKILDIFKNETKKIRLDDVVIFEKSKEEQLKILNALIDYIKKVELNGTI